MGKFEKGDRVRVVKKSDDWRDGGSCHRREIGEVFTLKDMNPSNRFWRTVEGPDFYPDEIEPATLTIEAGKFYKTRDGRKVGPAKLSEWTSGDWKWSLGQFWLFKDDGTSGGSDRENDLIAEWVDEPKAVAVAASNDNAEPAAKPKFKVGDRVVYVGKSSIVTTKDRIGWKGSVKSVDAHAAQVDYDNGVWGNQYFDNLELAEPATPVIVALIEDGKVKPATRPKVHPDQASATTEAERLALAHPGQQFGVFVLADSKIAEVVTETVQRTVLRAA